MSTVRLDQVPVLHVRGTNYQVGFAIGRTFMSLIQDFLDRWDYFKNVLLAAYDTDEGKIIYDRCLTLCQNKFSLYVQEIQGIADGSTIPFHHIFLLHIEAFITKENADGEPLERETKGCTCILVNKDDVVLAHTEDALPEMMNNFMIVSAHVVDEHGNTLEEFSSLTYPGYLPGYTMGYNVHGVVHTVNTILPLRTYSNRSPVYFICRALLGAKNKNHVLEILKDHGTGIGDGFSLNIVFAKENETPTLYNMEIGPNKNNGIESDVDVFEVPRGSSHAHCNKYLRLDTEEQGGKTWRSSDRRHAAIDSKGLPNCMEGVKNLLSDSPIYRTACKILDDKAATIAIGAFDVKKKTWSIYTGPPKSSAPVAVLTMKF